MSINEETELKKLVKKLEDLQTITQESKVDYEKTIALLKNGGSLSEQFIKTKSNYELSILTYEADNYLKVIDVCLDILKFLIPTLFSLWTVTRIISQFSGTSNFVFGTFSFLLVLLLVSILIRMVKVNSFVSKFKEAHRKFALEYTDWQKNMAEVEKLELDTLKKNLELLKERRKLVFRVK